MDLRREIYERVRSLQKRGFIPVSGEYDAVNTFLRILPKKDVRILSIDNRIGIPFVKKTVGLAQLLKVSPIQLQRAYLIEVYHGASFGQLRYNLSYPEGEEGEDSEVYKIIAQVVAAFLETLVKGV